MVGTEGGAPGARRGPGRPREERVTGAVLEAVLALATEQGVEAVTMDAVAARAGVSKPAIYRRWKSKQELVIAAAETRIGLLTVPDLGDLRAELRVILTARLEAYRLPGTARLLAELVGAVARTEEPGGGEYARYAQRAMGQTRTVIERGIARGQVRPEVDVRSVVTMVAAPLVYRLVVESELPTSALVDDVVELVARAVAPAD
jgi:AcrR family transcriptional regulator